MVFVTHLFCSEKDELLPFAEEEPEDLRARRLNKNLNSGLWFLTLDVCPKAPQKRLPFLPFSVS